MNTCFYAQAHHPSQPRALATRIILLSIAAACIGTAVLPAQAQNIWNDAAGRIVTSTTGIIRVRGLASQTVSVTGEIRNTNASLDALSNAGTIELLGKRIRFTGASADRVFGGSVERRIGGLVRWAGNDDDASQFAPQGQTQLVQGLAYTNLALSGVAPKSLLDTIRVGGDGTQPSAEALFYLGSGGYFPQPTTTLVSQASGISTSVPSGARTYAGMFIYDNARQQTLVGGEDYLHLELQRGAAHTRLQPFPAFAKRIPSGVVVQTRGVFRQRGSADSSTLANSTSSANSANSVNRSGLLIEGVLRVGGRTDCLFGGGMIAVGAPLENTTATAQALLGNPANYPRTVARAEALLQFGADTATIGVERLVVYAGTLASRSAGSASSSASGASSSTSAVIVLQSQALLRLAAVDAGAGSVSQPASTAPLVSTAGTFVLGARDVLLVSGTLRNELPSRLNTRFHPSSTVHYNALLAQTLSPSAPPSASPSSQSVSQPAFQAIMTTAEASPYGALELSGGDKMMDVVPLDSIDNRTGAPTGLLPSSMAASASMPALAPAPTPVPTLSAALLNASTSPALRPLVRTIAVAGGFRASAAQLYLLSPESSSALASASASASASALASAANFVGELVLLTPSAEVFYASVGERRGEVQGAMRRVLERGGNRAALTYTFTNAQTTVRFTDGIPPETMTLATRSARAGAAPANTQPASDVRRSVQWSWQPIASTDTRADSIWTATLRIGYSPNEVVPPFVAASEARLSFHESVPQNTSSNLAEADVVRVLGARSLMRLSAGGTGVGKTETELGWLEGSGFQPATTEPRASAPFEGLGATQFVAGRELLLRGITPLVRSVAHGRWSNPATWNVGREPDSSDAVEIVHVVHVGFRRTSVDGNTNDGQRREQAFVSLAGDSTFSAMLASSVRIRSTGALLVGFLDSRPTSGSGGSGGTNVFNDELSPEAAWWLASSEVRVESRLEPSATAPSSDPLTTALNAALSTMTRQGLVAATSGARANARTDYRGLLLFQPANQREGAIRLGSLVNTGTVLNGANVEVRDR
jgi:hypothetical protein